MRCEQFQKVTATFSPKQVETLRPELLKAVGVTAEFWCAWIIDQEDGGPYVSQGAFLTDDERFYHWWVPEEDLDIIRQHIKGKHAKVT